MMAILLWTVLIGPEPEYKKQDIIIHLATDFKSKVIISELKNPYFKAQNRYIRTRYNIIFVEDALRTPSISFSKNSVPEPFPKGTFTCSGQFINTLVSMLKINDYEKHNIRDYNKVIIFRRDGYDIIDNNIVPVYSGESRYVYDYFKPSAYLQSQKDEIHTPLLPMEFP